MAAEAATNRENFRGPQGKARYLLLLEGEEDVTEVFYVSWDVTTKPLQCSMNLCEVKKFFFFFSRSLLYVYKDHMMLD